ncbi:DUF421 domain-containing protein [Alteribacillus bidgolensis]|uniref:YetF C-terminal domain-containing protein n=1 Tax=Alteribacillus bidgolensis TaxID=930129 RepID=A0A1G8NH40_9BACI|nr:DUF421 domain-containing protein [Alteribacillus bidgolensis]SDI79478.1 Protein of unknown function [Alteribacillus bidgolensis]
MIWIVETITQKFDNLRTLMKGSSSILIEDGKVNTKALKKAKLEMEQLRTLLRMQGIFSLRQVEHAVLETSGMVSVMEKAREEPVSKGDVLEDYEKNVPTYLVVEEKDINDRNLKLMGKSKEWLLDELQKLNYHLEDIYFAEWSKTDGFFIQSYQETSKEK